MSLVMLTRVELRNLPTEDPRQSQTQTGFAWVNPWGINGVEGHTKADATWVRMDDGYTYLVAESPEEIVELVNTELDK